MSFGLFLLNLQIIAIVMQMKRINRLKIVLAEQGKTGKWLAHALGKNESTVSRWCTKRSSTFGRNTTDDCRNVKD